MKFAGAPGDARLARGNKGVALRDAAR